MQTPQYKQCSWKWLLCCGFIVCGWSGNSLGKVRSQNSHGSVCRNKCNNIMSLLVLILLAHNHWFTANLREFYFFSLVNICFFFLFFRIYCQWSSHTAHTGVSGEIDVILLCRCGPLEHITGFSKVASFLAKMSTHKMEALFTATLFNKYPKKTSFIHCTICSSSLWLICFKSPNCCSINPKQSTTVYCRCLASPYTYWTNKSLTSNNNNKVLKEK